MELLNFMEDIDLSEFEYHVVSSVPDFRTKLARLALICRLIMVVAKGENMHRLFKLI
jgi:hypothetical protein